MVPPILSAVDDFIRRSEAVCRPEALFDLFAEAIGPLGFPAVAYLGYRFGDETAHPPIVMSNCPGGWFARYTEKDYGLSDPVLIGAVRDVVPFTWDPASAVPPLPPRKKHRDAEAAHELRGGAAVPIHGFAGEFAMVCLASAEGEADFETTWRQYRHVAHVMSLHLHSRIVQALMPGRPRRAPVLLSEREAECLIWMARGKTNWEIAEILRLSEKTIENYLENIKRKLGVYTKTQAVVNAIMRGLIKP
ncbi:MAG: autoinducer binding domain-containing protein [Alphaproteobacteria bacterium]